MLQTGSLPSFGIGEMTPKPAIRRVLVTGGAGFIGSHIVDRLIDEGYEVGVFDNLSTGDLSNLSLHGATDYEFYHGDITDFELVKSVMRDFDAIVHQAAVVSVTRSIEDPILANMVNATGTLNLLKAAISANVGLFLYASSSSVYGETKSLPKRETMKTMPMSPYAASKLAAENYCRVFAKVYGLRTISLRYFNVYGPRQKDGVYSGVIPTFIKRLIHDEPPVIFGDGQQTRDFTYVEDVVQANLLCLKKSIKAGEVFNIARGEPATIDGLANEIQKQLGKKHIPVKYDLPRRGDVRASYANINKARTWLRYVPKYDLAEGLREVIGWFRGKSFGLVI